MFGMNYTLNAWKNLIEDRGSHARPLFLLPGYTTSFQSRSNNLMQKYRSPQ